jgi:hypothetical protein
VEHALHAVPLQACALGNPDSGSVAQEDPDDILPLQRRGSESSDAPLR